MSNRAVALACLWLLPYAAACSDASSTEQDIPDTEEVTDTLIVIPDTDVVTFDTAPDGSDDTQTGPDAVIPGGFLAPCQGNRDCLDGYCVEGPEGFFCTRSCTSECPDDYDCRSVQTASADPAFLCLPRLVKVCVPCRADYQCTGGACLQLDGGGWCASVCEEDAQCPTGYGCLPDAAGEHTGRFCQPRSGSCDCTTESAGALRTCTESNTVGTCYGVETCDPETGWHGCSAQVPSVEVCDGRDNDCNALVDDGVDNNAACEVTVEGVGTCTGVQICTGTQGYVCTAQTPEVEVCDFRDNNCDGVIDEGFAVDGVYLADGHCGTCNNDCATKIPHGEGRCEAVEGASPVCVVERCDDDYIAINRFQCALPPDVSCQPCAADGDCFGGSCIDLDGQRVCATACGGASGACQDGYRCQDVGGVERCLPETGSCVCNAQTIGQSRTCSNSNAAGTCFGQETCGADGWTACTARVPAAEICDGLDNDCNGRADDGVTPPAEACASTVAGVGTCSGTWFCTDPDGTGPQSVGWTCSAPTPRAEVCDFLDDNCDGRVDEDFKNAQGLYVNDAHCGSCGVSCAGAIPNATAACAVADGRARCEVVTCAPGFYKAGPTTCVSARAEVCAPCATDANCPTPGDRCLELDGGRVCGRDCSASNLYGTPAGQCGAGEVCQAFGEARQCVPASGSCSCLAGDVGETRSCVATNAIGTCFGQQTCGQSGWSSCSARVPAVESCNGVDDDCNAAIDDVAGRGESCTLQNGFGVCPGVRDCSGGGLQCVGRAPAAETCNGVDDDCDGTTDEGFPGLGQVCSVGVGICQAAGVNVCAADGQSVRCSASPLPAASSELCNGLDDDCDGQTDETFPGKNTVCEVGEGVCKRFGTQVCTANGQGLTCNAVAGTGGVEVCDLLDNDCDGQVDEDFRVNGKYAAATACGNCFTDCTAIYARPNAFGTCDAVPATPVCRMNCQAGYFDLNGVPDDGCEFQLDPTAVYVSESDANASDAAGCGGGPSATGGGRFPCKKITRGLDLAATAGSGKNKVLVAGGAYHENVTLRNGIRLLGGYNPVNWTRNVRSNLTAIFGVAPSGHRKTVIADGITAANTAIDGFTIYGQLANGTAENSYAIWVRNSTSGLSITNNVVWPGTGGPGQAGTRGSDGANGGSGAAGQSAREVANARCFGECSGNNPGGAGGANAACGTGTAGGRGADAPCPDWNEGVDLCGSNAAGVSQSSNPAGQVGQGASGGTAGVGGCDQLIDPDITGCSCNVPGVSAACPLGEYSSGGGDGGLGPRGGAGTRNANAAGEVSGAEWRGFGGGSGLAGGHGSGGGGGGAGGGVESYYNGTNCSSRYSDFGGSGGGGGAGGCGGTGGSGGGAGGGAFGVFVVFTTAPNPTTNVPTITGNELHQGFGGIGGRGGDGGTAGRGGAGGMGGPGAPAGTAWCAQPGSKGGEGGDGGPGGGGAGGAGGVSYGFFAAGGSAATWASGNTFHADGAGGIGGVGGGTGAGGNSGQLGLAGASATRNF